MERGKYLSRPPLHAVRIRQAVALCLVARTPVTTSRITAGSPVTKRNIEAALGSSSAWEPKKFWMVKSSRARPIIPMTHSYHLKAISLDFIQLTNHSNPAPTISPMINHIFVFPFLTLLRIGRGGAAIPTERRLFPGPPFRSLRIECASQRTHAWAKLLLAVSKVPIHGLEERVSHRRRGDGCPHNVVYCRCVQFREDAIAHADVASPHVVIITLARRHIVE